MAACACGVVGLSALSAMGQSWMASSAATDVNGTVNGLKMWDPDGAGPLAPVLVATGNFTTAGAASPATRAAMWDGTAWSGFGSGGGPDANTQAVTTLSSNNNVYFVSTGMATANAVSTRRIAGWDGATWYGLGTGTGNTPPLTLTSASTVNADTIVVAGAFTSIGGVSANRIATWNVANGWAALGDGMSSTCFSCLALANGNILVSGGGEVTGGDGSVTVNRIARWDGTNWHRMGLGFTTTDSVAHPAGLARAMIELPDGDVVAGGSFVQSGPVDLNKIARWDSATDTWGPLGLGINNDTGFNHDVYALALMPNGDLVVGGDFTTAGGAAHNYIARWNFTTSTWSAMAPGDVGVGGPVRSLAVLPNGDLAVGGDFLTAGGQPAQRFTIWREPSVVATPPTITTEPTSQTVSVTDSAHFTLVASGSEPLTYRWQQQDLFNLPDFVDIEDGYVVDPFFNPIAFATGATTNHLVLSELQGVAQIFRCVVTNAHGTAISAEVTLSFPPFCASDMNGDGSSTIDDLFLYLNLWFQSDPSADFNTDGSTTIDDLFLYLNAWFTGC